MGRHYESDKHLPDGRLKSQMEWWKRNTKTGGGEKLKVTIRLTPAERRMMARFGRLHKLSGHTAIVRKALEMALEGTTQ